MKFINWTVILIILNANMAAVSCIADEFPSSLSVGIKTDDSGQNDFVLYARESVQTVVKDAEKEEDIEYPEEEEAEIADPLEPINRLFFHFNDKLYFWILKPVAKGYSAVVPEDVRISIRNIFDNVSTPARLVNNLLQLKLKPAGKELIRFGINSTAGMLGLYDFARDEMGISMQDEDFGQTLGVWGLGPVIYINWPIIGPSSVRDSIGYAGDYFLTPVNYVNPIIDRIAIEAGEEVNKVSLSIGDYEGLKRDSIDPYYTIRDVYYQHREDKIKR